MSGEPITKQAAGKAADWAIIPFDEAEDEARWNGLIEETGRLIAEAESLADGNRLPDPP